MNLRNSESMTKPRLSDRKTGPAIVSQHTIPAIDRMMSVLAALEGQAAGASIKALTTSLSLPRSTVYRTLNSLEVHGVVQRDTTGCYRLGRRLLFPPGPRPLET